MLILIYRKTFCYPPHKYGKYAFFNGMGDDLGKIFTLIFFFLCCLTLRIETTIRSPRFANFLRNPPKTFMHLTFFAPELSVTRSNVSVWIIYLCLGCSRKYKATNNTAHKAGSSTIKYFEVQANFKKRTKPWYHR